MCQQPLTLSPSSGSVLGNNVGKEGAEALVAAANDKLQLVTLCGIKAEETACDLSRRGLNTGDAILLAFDLRKNSALVKLEYAAARPFQLSAAICL